MTLQPVTGNQTRLFACDETVCHKLEDYDILSLRNLCNDCQYNCRKWRPERISWLQKVHNPLLFVSVLQGGR